MLNNLLDELNASICSHGGQALDLPSEFKENYSPKKKSKINSWLWDVPGFRRWRVTRFDAGRKIQVLNSVAYPSLDKKQPIMGIDLLWFEEREKLVAILDFQPLSQKESYLNIFFEDLKNIHNNYHQFRTRDSIIRYDPNLFFSPWVLFCKGGKNEFENLLPKIFTPFLESYWKIQDLQGQDLDEIDSLNVKEMQKEYDSYSARNDPAHSLFKGFFGPKWSDKFMKEFLFPLS